MPTPSSQPSTVSPQVLLRHPSSRNRSSAQQLPHRPKHLDTDRFVAVTMGDYRTLITTQSLRSQESLLPHLLREAQQLNSRNSEGHLQLYLEGDGASFRHVDFYLREGKLPRGLSEMDLTYIKATARNLLMPKLDVEASALYHFREDFRASRINGASDPISHLAAAVTLAAHLVFNGIEQDAEHQLSRCVALTESLTPQAIAQAGLAQSNPLRASFLFATLMLPHQSLYGQKLYLESLLESPVQSHFFCGPVGPSLRGRGEIEASELFLCAAEKFFPNEPHALLAQHIRTRNMATSDYAGAEALAREALLNAHENKQLLAILGTSLCHQTKYQEAQNPLMLARYMYPPFSLFYEAHTAMGRCAMALGNTGAAKSCFEAAHHAAPYQPEPYRYMVEALSLDGPAWRTLQWQQRLLDLTPNDPMCHVNLGILHHNQGMFLEAIASFDRADALNPNDIATLRLKIETAKCLGWYSKAIGAQYRIVQESPNDGQARLTLSELYTLNDEPQRAAYEAQRARGLIPGGAAVREPSLTLSDHHPPSPAYLFAEPHSEILGQHIEAPPAADFGAFINEAYGVDSSFTYSSSEPEDDFYI